MRLTPSLLLLATLGTACGSLNAPPEELDLWNDAAAGVDDRTLADLCERVWESDLRDSPFRATSLGDPRLHGEVPDVSRVGRDQRLEELRELRLRATGIDASRLNEKDRLTRELLIQELEGRIAVARQRFEEWTVDPLSGPHITVLNLAQEQPTDTPRQREQLLERWSRLPRYVHQSGENLEAGQRRGRTASRTAIEKCVQQLAEILATPPMDSPLVTIAMGGGRWVELPAGGSVAAIAQAELGDARRQSELRLLNLHLQDAARVARGTRVMIQAEDDSLTPEERGRFLREVLASVEDGIYPAFAGYRDVLVEDILPAARDDLRPGLAYLPGGPTAYATMIRRHTTLPEDECDPEAIHAFGLQEVERIRSEISALGLGAFGTSDVAVIQERLRTDPSLHFATREEVEAKAAEALARAYVKAPEFFGILPEAECEVVRIAPYEEKDTTIAYYRGPAADGSRPGQYFINTYAPETRPRYEAEVLAYHEAVPGHHLQIAIAQELEQLPLFRRYGGSTAFVEGWALYTERLCDEMGLYSGNLDRLGVLSFDAWRACRLVVDTGIHSMGWSREKAIQYLFENTLLARNNCENEIDRYIAWPGQALAYKLGQREILALRDRAQAVQGDAFDYAEFHDRVLENGAVTLEALRGIVSRWLEG